jgi:hypothetical protein
MAKRLTVTVTVEDDILVRLRDLHRQATVERSHYYVADAMMVRRGAAAAPGTLQVRERRHQ